MIDRGTGPGGTRDAGLDEEIGTVGRATADAVAGGPAATDAAATWSTLATWPESETSA
jgi:hypothetical protein